MPETTAELDAPKQRRKSLPAWAEFLLLVVAALTIAVLIKTFLVQAFMIPSGSMEDTLLVGDRVLVSKTVYHTRDIERGDIVVFDGSGSFVKAAPQSNVVVSLFKEIGSAIGLAQLDDRDFIKRVIGVGGDHVVCCDVQGRITVNGVPLDEQSYLYPGDVPSKQKFNVVVPENTLWLMGDHRSNSADSRSHLGDPGGGFVPVDKVIGRAFAVVWPFSRRQFLDIPSTFSNPALVGSVSHG